jgi:hypothetical protein
MELLQLHMLVLRVTLATLLEIELPVLLVTFVKQELLLLDLSGLSIMERCVFLENIVPLDLLLLLYVVLVSSAHNTSL